MAILDILVYPDSRLRQIARPVSAFDRSLKSLVNDMAETMYDAPGIGLAAIQVNDLRRVVTIDVSDARDQLQVFINPQLSELNGSVETEEGCLSVPGVFASVSRAETVLVRAQDVSGNLFEVVADEILAVCIQHEIDHLDGKVFVDYLSRLKQDRIRKRLIKEFTGQPVRDRSAIEKIAV
ncbi:MAG: peptide deformylase [Parasphingorhabdus sp.]|jgi:peptide deformylase